MDITSTNTAVNNALKKISVFFEKTFSNIIVEGPAIDPLHVQSNNSMFACSHRSHTDYIMLGYILHKMGYRNMRFAAGDNLIRFPILGKKFVSFGAFPVYRAKASHIRYIMDLANQVASMLMESQNVIVFPEGGRSYYGEMMEIKNGILASNIIAQHNMQEKNFYYMPFTISYEELPEINYFKLLLRGKEIRQSSNILEKMVGNIIYFGADLAAFSKFMLANKFSYKYGDVFIDYGKPFSIGEITDIQKNFDPKAKNCFSAHRKTIEAISREIYLHLYQLYRILPIHIVSALLEKSGQHSKQQLIDQIPSLIDKTRDNNRNNKTLEKLTASDIFEKGILGLSIAKAIDLRNSSIIIKRPELISYYASTLGPRKS